MKRCHLGVKRTRIWLATAATGIVLMACSQQKHFLGYDLVTQVPNSSATTSAEPPTDAGTPMEAGLGSTSAQSGTSLVSQATDDAGDTGESDGGLVDVTLNDPPNVLVDVLELEPDRVVQRTTSIFEKLFFGDPSSESIFVDEPDGAYVFDVYHDDTRMDAMGYGMLALVYFDHQAEFDKLWSTVDTKFRYPDGARSRYFHHSCATDFSECSDDIDTFGVLYVVTALFIAESRWGGSTYAAAATDILVTMRSKEQNGIQEGVLNLFDADGFPRRVPLEGESSDIWAGSLMPAFLELWYVNTKDIFWHQAAEQSRALLQVVVHPETGLAPERVDRMGSPTQEMPEFREGTYAVGFQMALDQAWVGPQPGYTTSVDLLVGFFGAKGPGYASLWTIEGEALNDLSSFALIALNGAAASIATVGAREGMIRAAWELGSTSGQYRYYDGMSQLLSLMLLGGQFKPE